MAKKKKKGSKGLVIGIVVVLVIVGVSFLFSAGGSKYSTEELDRFAKCLTESGTVMYGTYWCPHCAKTKKMFGESFRHINYIECDPNGENEQAELCIEEGIEAYDTWEFPDGTRYVSEPSFDLLAERSGCPAPQESE